jgi:hypothetical protein
MAIQQRMVEMENQQQKQYQEQLFNLENGNSQQASLDQHLYRQYLESQRYLQSLKQQQPQQPQQQQQQKGLTNNDNYGNNNHATSNSNSGYVLPSLEAIKMSKVLFNSIHFILFLKSITIVHLFLFISLAECITSN